MDSSGSLPINPTSPDPVTPELHLPASVGWYREAANWLVGLATAALIFGITNIEKLPSQPLTLWLYALMLLAFLITTLSGIFFYFFITEYAHNFLRREKYAALYAIPTITPVQKNEYAIECAKGQKEAKESAQNYSVSFKIMLPSFSIGVFFAFCLAVNMLLIEKPEKVVHIYKLQAIPSSLPIQRVTCCCPSRPLQAIPTTLPIQHGVMMINEATGTSWLLESDTVKQFKWRIITPPVDTTKR